MNPRPGIDILFSKDNAAFFPFGVEPVGASFAASMRDVDLRSDMISSAAENFPNKARFRPLYGRFPRAIVSPDTHCSVRESDGSSCGVVRAAALSSPAPSLPSLTHPATAPLDVALACAKLRAINVATSEFFVNSQAVCLSLPMIRSLRCLRNAKGPSPEDPSRRFSSSLTCCTPRLPPSLPSRPFSSVSSPVSRFPRRNLPVKST